MDKKNKYIKKLYEQGNYKFKITYEEFTNMITQLEKIYNNNDNSSSSIISNSESKKFEENNLNNTSIFNLMMLNELLLNENENP